MVFSDVIDQVRGKRAKKKEAKCKQYVMAGNINSYSKILNNEESLEWITGYNSMTVGTAMVNIERD